MDDKVGSVAIEYALIGIFLGVAIIAALLTIGPEVAAQIQSPVAALK